MKTTLMNKNSLELGTYSTLMDQTVEGTRIDKDIISGSLLLKTKFIDVTFSCCVFYACHLDQLQFSGCRFENCQFIFSHISNCNFQACQFQDSIWENTRIQNSSIKICIADSKTYNEFFEQDNVIKSIIGAHLFCPHFK